ncbi:ABC transporter permease [Candidatus Acetothermia bacterium]|nr:ABC transporter permease [Candidatus Acetothermia bacterium]
MAKYILKRLFQIILTLWIYLTIVFLLLYLQPGDITSFFINNRTPPEVREQIKAQFGLNKPIWEQYTNVMTNFVTLNLGVSFKEYPRPVWDIVTERMPRTALLFVTAAIISFCFGFILGRLIGWRRGAALEYVSTVSGVFLWTVFTPWFALLMIWLFAFNFQWFPLKGFIDQNLWPGVQQVADVSCDLTGGTNCANFVFNHILLTALVVTLILGAAFIISRFFAEQRTRWLINGSALAITVIGVFNYWSNSIGDVKVGGIFATRPLSMMDLAGDILYHMILPIITLTLISFAGTMLLTRNTMLESLREDYIMAARAKGLPDKAVRDRHAARNALLPVATYFVIGLALSVDGSIFIEKIFTWKGMGWTLLSSATDQDYPVIIGALVFTGIFALFAHLAADVLYALLDPRIRYD